VTKETTDESGSEVAHEYYDGLEVCREEELRFE
jgi:hypothetical protein